ncbi:hypothetical protein BC828DRAFT_405373 [Blastocladiella britannica]|nr:hypothetical protein BC828DRAFT_405373 [Blastocladiella britannica]
MATLIALNGLAIGPIEHQQTAVDAGVLSVANLAAGSTELFVQVVAQAAIVPDLAALELSANPSQVMQSLSDGGNLVRALFSTLADPDVGNVVRISAVTALIRVLTYELEHRDCGTTFAAALEPLMSGYPVTDQDKREYSWGYSLDDDVDRVRHLLAEIRAGPVALDDAPGDTYDIGDFD